MIRIREFFGLVLFLFASSLSAQEIASVNVDAPEQQRKLKDTTNTFKRIKVDGVAAVVGDYVILESDIDRLRFELETQGGAAEGIDRCQLMGKLMEDKLYAHHAIQDSILISENEIQAQVGAKIDYLVRELGSIENVLAYYRKDSEDGFRQELYELERSTQLSQRMQNKILESVEITPEEVRQWFRGIPENELPIFGAELEISQIVREPKVSQEEKDKVVNRLWQIKRDVEDNGASFSLKAILNSKDEGSRANGGFLSLNKKTNFVKEFKDVSFNLELGQVSDPFETIYGWHIIKLEKIRGQERDVRHILLIPEVSENSMEEAKNELALIKKRIEDGEMSFAEAAKNFSDQKETKYDGGVLRNPVNFDTKFELTKMDPALYNQVRDLKGDEISYPLLVTNPRTDDATGYKILKVSNRFDEHRANFSADYLKIRDLALRDKQRKAIKEWTEEKIKATYVSISVDNRECNFVNNWLKK